MLKSEWVEPDLQLVASSVPQQRMILVTPSQAERWLIDCPYEHQRPKRPYRVEYLAKEMRAGRFTQGTQIAFGLLESRAYLINGQHTLSAIVSSNAPQLLDVLWLPADTKEGLGKLYYRFDRHLSRTPSDSFTAMELNTRYGLTATWINKLGGAVRFIKCGFRTSGGKNVQISTDELIDGMDEYAEPCKQFVAITERAQTNLHRPLARAASLSVALVTLKFAVNYVGHDRVASFWRGVAFDDGLTKGDPRKVLVHHLLAVGMTGGGLTSNKTHVVSASYSARHVANCWNAWVEERPLTMTKVFDAHAPIRIAGTPYKGKE